MVSGQTPAANLPERTVVLVVVGGLLIALQAIRERGSGTGPLTLLPWKGTELPLGDSPALEAVSSFTFLVFRLRWSLSSVEAWDIAGGRGGGAFLKKVGLQPSSSPSMSKVSLTQELLPICLSFLSVQLQSLALNVLFGGKLCTIGVDVSDNTSVQKVNECVIDKMTVD
jgi:hypothetical protein